jgi:hypothetical protein
MQCRTKENGGPGGTRRNLSSLRDDLEVDRETGEHVPTQRIIDLREGVAVTEAGRNSLLAGNRRIDIEYIVDTGAKVEPLGHAGGEREVEIIPSAQPQVGQE